MITYINSKWCCKSEVFFKYSQAGIDCLTVVCYPKFSRFPSTAISNIYIAPQCSSSDIDDFYDNFLPAIAPSLADSLHIIAGDFNHAPLYPLLSLNLSDLIHAPTRGSSFLDHIITNNPDTFSSKYFAPLSTSDHNLILVRPKIYSYSGHISFTQPKHVLCHQRDLSPGNIALLRKSLVVVTNLFSGNEPCLSDVSFLTDVLNRIFDICCPVITLFLQHGRISTVFLKRLRREKERAFKCGKKTEVKLLSLAIKDEVKRLDLFYASQFFGTRDSKGIWRGIKLLCRQKKVALGVSVDVEQLNSAFIHPTSETLTSLPSPISPRTPSIFEPITPGEMFKHLRSLKVSSAAGPDNLSPALLKHGADSLSNFFAYIANLSLELKTIPECWRPVRITPIPKTTTQVPISKRFRPIALTSSGLKLMERSVLQRLQVSLTIPEDNHQFAYKRNRSTLDAVASLFHFVCKSLNDKAKHVHCAFLDYSSAFDSVPRSLLLKKLQSFGCPSSLLEWLQDYFSRRYQYVKLGKQQSTSSLNNSGVLQGAVLSPFLFTTYISDLPVDLPVRHFKYADDIAISFSISNETDLDLYNTNISRLVEFSTSSGLNLNPDKCIECIFSLNRSPPLTDGVQIKGKSMCRASHAKYLGVILESNLRWSLHAQSVVRKLRGLSFQIKRLRQFCSDQSVMVNFVQQCVLPIFLYCSPVIFPGLLKADFKLLRRGLKMISRVSQVSLSALIGNICDRHIDACLKFADRIFSDSTHPLHLDLSACLSHPSTRSTYRLIPSRISVYRNSPVPYLARILTDKVKVRSELLDALSS